MKLIGFSGRKQAGKDTAANYLNGVILKKAGSILDFNILDDGSLNVLTRFANGEEDWGILDLYRKDELFIEAAERTMWPFVKTYSFSDALKETAVNLFELSHESVYGTDEQKNAPTHLKWENMPGVYTHNTKAYKALLEADPLLENILIQHDPGYMTGREFLQFLGTEIGRRMYESIWINATINRILKEQSGLAIITDIRFPNEVQAVDKVGGLIFRLAREAINDPHISEKALDKDVFDWNLFHTVIDNSNLTIKETCKIVHKEATRLQLI